MGAELEAILPRIGEVIGEGDPPSRQSGHEVSGDLLQFSLELGPQRFVFGLSVAGLLEASREVQPLLQTFVEEFGGPYGPPTRAQTE